MFDVANSGKRESFFRCNIFKTNTVDSRTIILMRDLKNLQKINKLNSFFFKTSRSRISVLQRFVFAFTGHNTITTNLIHLFKSENITCEWNLEN